MPPEVDASLPQGRPILDDSTQTNLNDWFDSPDHNPPLMLQDTALTSFANAPDFGSALDNDTSWNFTPFAFNETSSFAEQYPQSTHHLPGLNDNRESNPRFSSVPQYPAPSNNHSLPQPANHVLSGFGIAEDAPEDVLKAAAKLYEYTSQREPSILAPQHSDSQHQSVLQNHAPKREHRPSQAYQLPATISSSYQPPSNYPQLPTHFRASTGNVQSYTPPSTMSFNSQRHSVPTSHSFAFGTDIDFNPNGYTGTYQQVNEQSHMQFAQNMGTGTAVRYGDGSVPSAASSHPQSPVNTRQDNQYPQPQVQPSYYIPRRLEREEEDVGRSNSRKRRRMTTGTGDGQNGRQHLYNDDTPPPAADAGSSPDADDVSDDGGSSPSPDPADDELSSGKRKRRKSSSAARTKGSAARKNLTDAQKRSNHIASEQKRRNIIKEGYKNLNELVPNLKQGGFSKSATLHESVRELETLQVANETWKFKLMKESGLSQEDLQAIMDSM